MIDWVSCISSLSFVLPEGLLDLIRQWNGGAKGVRGTLFMGAIIQGTCGAFGKSRTVESLMARRYRRE